MLVKQKAGWLGIPKIQPFTGYGNEESIYIQGIVTENKSLEKTSNRNTVFQNMLAMIKRFSGDSIPGARVKCSCLGQEIIQESDEHGYFDFHFKFPGKQSELKEKAWISAEFELVEQIVDDQPVIRSTGKIRIIPDSTERIIISDVDDTVLVSHSTQTFRKLWLMLFLNARKRKPLVGVDSFYRALELGKNKSSLNPFFYVSSSEWNLFDLLEDFFDHNDIPRGVFLLRKLTYSIWKFWKSGQGDHQHKYHKIKFLITLYPYMNFILIGDSGQKDPEIYKRLAREFPSRIEAIYIRKIGKHQKEKRLEYTEERSDTIPYLEIDNTLEAFQHAAENGYIHPESMENYETG
jgi:phosphatidate phosphatase APP1